MSGESCPVCGNAVCVSSRQCHGAGEGGVYLEGQVLEEVCGAVGLLGLCPGAGVYPHANGRRLCVWGVLGGDLRGRTRLSVTRRADRMVVGARTVRPFFRVVVWVLLGEGTGEAKPRRMGSERPARPRRPCDRFRASLRDAIGVDVAGIEWVEIFVRDWSFDLGSRPGGAADSALVIGSDGLATKSSVPKWRPGCLNLSGLPHCESLALLKLPTSGGCHWEAMGQVSNIS